jgi:hypothetical protein
MAGAGDLVLTRLPERAAALMLPEELEGSYTVVSVSNGEVVARVDKKPVEAQRLTLPTGRYVVRKVRRTDVLVSQVNLAWGGHALGAGSGDDGRPAWRSVVPWRLDVAAVSSRGARSRQQPHHARQPAVRWRRT